MVTLQGHKQICHIVNIYILGLNEKKVKVNILYYIYNKFPYVEIK
jgi:hypothetical protein